MFSFEISDRTKGEPVNHDIIYSLQARLPALSLSPEMNTSGSYLDCCAYSASLGGVKLNR